MNFLALSHAPPELAYDNAIHTPLTNTPGNNPAMAVGPNNKPINIGTNITIQPGNIIYYKLADVDI
jgi:hypothetical protein